MSYLSIGYFLLSAFCMYYMHHASTHRAKHGGMIVLYFFTLFTIMAAVTFYAGVVYL